MQIQNVKGTHDIIGAEADVYENIENLLKHIATVFAFKQLRPPVLEHSELFVRGVGESSDVVRKEMYTFEDKGGRSLTLRPEFTAGIVRLMVQNKILNNNELPYKAFYLGPVFRYERPQLGRYRQFNQFGVESIGHNSPVNDLEVIVLAYVILQSLGLENVTIKINTLGDEQSRNNYKGALKEYFAKHLDKMCSDCHSRFELNPLRILDCKVPEDQEIVKSAPKMGEYLSAESKERFAYILKSLDELEIPYEVDESLVRGLDYYSETVFEFHYTSKTGNNYGAIGAGGHYDKLVKELGGPDVPGVGFSFGIERLVSVLSDDGLVNIEEDEGIAFYVMPLGIKSQIKGLNVANAVRLLGYATDMCFDDIKLASMFKRAEKKGARYAIILGENEIANDEVIIKDLHTQKQSTIPMDILEDRCIALMSEHQHHCGCGCDHEHDHEHEDHECCCGHHHDEEEGK